MPFDKTVITLAEDIVSGKTRERYATTVVAKALLDTSQRLEISEGNLQNMIARRDLLKTALGEERERLERARVTIENAPHTKNCRSLELGYFPGEIGFRQRGFPYPCNCWKSRALAADRNN